jgi:hypothetical protein
MIQKAESANCLLEILRLQALDEQRRLVQADMG